MEQHDYVRHTLDCLEEAQAALRLAQRKGQIEPKDETQLIRSLDTLTERISRVQQSH
ncbi:hypothetical protein [Azospirillum soli]|uniref:hypothetical protein n=1 Tax=Azospirillum soli TaxID=1304799 RepID=UPI001AE93DF1|nr:hypothetical protein [Azospirillum soli]MBP2316480.1 hypothetical protein [Azospirillum soli]